MRWSDFDAIIFDLDGTLVQSMGMWRRVDDIFLGKRGIDVPDGLQKDLAMLSYNETAVYFKERFRLSESLDEIKQEWHVLASEQYRSFVPLRDGASELIWFLTERNVRLGVGSSCSKDLIRDALRAHGLLEAFECILSCDEAGKNKPDPAVYLAIAEKMDVNPKRALVFEDIPVGIEAAYRAGMRVIGVYDGQIEDDVWEIRYMTNGFIQDYRELLPEIPEDLDA